MENQFAKVLQSHFSSFSEMASSNSTSNDSVVYEAPCFLCDMDLIRALRVAPFAPIAFFAMTGNPGASCCLRKKDNEKNHQLLHRKHGV